MESLGPAMVINKVAVSGHLHQKRLPLHNLTLPVVYLIQQIDMALLVDPYLATDPRAVEISRFVCAALIVVGFTNTNAGSFSECSAQNESGSPSTTELTASGIRIAVANRGAR